MSDDFFTVEHEEDSTIPEDTVLRVRLVDLKRRTIEYTDKKTGAPASFDKLDWWFEVTSPEWAERPDGSVRKIKGETDAKVSTHPANQMRPWAEALLGRELAVGVGFGASDLLGLTADAVVGHQVDRKNPLKKWERIRDLLPIQGGLSADDEPPF